MNPYPPFYFHIGNTSWPVPFRPAPKTATAATPNPRLVGLRARREALLAELAAVDREIHVAMIEELRAHEEARR